MVNTQSSERTRFETVEATINSTSTPEFLQSEGDRHMEQIAKQCCYVNFRQHLRTNWMTIVGMMWPLKADEALPAYLQVTSK